LEALLFIGEELQQTKESIKNLEQHLAQIKEEINGWAERS
jgi:FtsZ-binding cell division protein ZapB